MTTARSIVCGSCGSDVPYGRLSCPACGDLLASVAGGTRRATGADGRVPSPAGSPAVAGTMRAERIVPPVLHDASDPVDDRSWLEADDEPSSSLAPEPSFDVEAATLAFDAESTAALDAGPAATPAPEPALAAASAPVATPAPPWIEPATPSIDDAFPQPGAWVPPSSAAMAAASIPAGPAAPARAWAGHAAADAATADRGIGRTGDSAGADAAAGRLVEFIGWLAIAGGALSAVGFLLPWGVSMIGATGSDYLDRWGLAGPFHAFVALAVVAVVVLVIVPNRVPSWIRIGLAGTILGVFMLGLVWPYTFGFSSPGPGALAVAVGALLLLAAGVTCLVADRQTRATTPG